jgi:hypothetical protein
MKLKTFTLFLICGLLFTSTLFSQEQDTTWNYGDENQNEWKFDEDWKDFHFDIDFDWHGRPTINALYGFGKTSLNKFNNSFSQFGYTELRLGYLSYDFSNECSSLINYEHNYLSVSSFNQNLKGIKTSDDVNADVWRITLGWEDGYGYSFGKSGIIFYNSTGMGWTRFKFSNYKLSNSLTPTMISEDNNRLNYFNESFRFGTKAEGGIKIQFIPELSVDASYERFAVFPRHLFWKQLGSAIIEYAGQGLLEEFIDKIKTNSPAAAPIVYFVLKNALSYGIYELRKEKMNWPFNTSAPIMTDMFKFGLTFSF